MSWRRPTPLVLRGAAALGVGVVLTALTAPASQALGLPDPVATAVNGVTTTVQGATGGLGLPVPGASAPSPTAATASGASTARPSASPSGQASTSAPGAASASPSPRRAGASGTSSASSGAVVDSPAATVCLIPTGGSSPAVRVDLRAAGVDLSSPLVTQFPQALAPCPAGAVPAGDHVLSVDAAIDGLLGACVRVTTQVVPVQTTLVVLDHDLITELTQAGVPLDRLVVPCPAVAAGASSTQGPATGSGHPGSPGAGGAAAALPAGLAFTGGDPLPMAVVGAGLLWFGVLLTRAARAAVSGAAVRG